MTEIWILTIFILNTGKSWESPRTYPTLEICEKVGQRTIDMASVKYPTQPIGATCTLKPQES